MIVSQSAGHAKSYFSDALSRSDYYVSGDKQELQGLFLGRLADRLGLTGAVTKEAFFSLCENINPLTGKSLTPRVKDNRIIGYDINFHVPKSCSILHALSGDDHILRAFQKSARDTMQEVEADSKTRVRKGGIYNDRNTGELIYAEFIHQTARPLDGHLPDPHLHAHFFLFNATWDEKEQKIKAGKFRDIKRDMPWYQAQFIKRLADNLIDQGYQIRRTEHSFEIVGVPQEVIAHFSKRTNEIGRVANEKGIVDAKTKAQLGARTRSKKQKGLTMSELRANWRLQMQQISKIIEGDMNNAVRFARQAEKSTITAKQCVIHAKQHCFERASVVPERQVLQAAYKYAIGERNVSLDDITSGFREDKEFLSVKVGGQNFSTTHEVLSEEKRMVALATAGRGKNTPLLTAPPFLGIHFTDQQKTAITYVMMTTDAVSIIRGAAGTGKTTIMTEIDSLVRRAGKKMIVVAPTAEASRGVLKDEGFKDAETVAKLLVDKELQEQIKNNVLYVDEAGLLGTKDMIRLLELTNRQKAQLVLCGDTKQHAAVARGDALRILNMVGGIKSAEVNKIHRQKNETYKQAVYDLSNGQIFDGFKKLDQMGAIKTIDPLNPNEQLVTDYVAALKKKKTGLVISPTHAQGDAVTAEIRKRLQELQLIGQRESTLTRFMNLNFTQAAKQDFRSYEAGQWVQFNQHHKKIKRGSAWQVKSVADKTVTITNEQGFELPLPLQTGQFDVFKKSEIGISKGDKVRITHNGFDQNNKRLNNGMSLEVVSISPLGETVLRNKVSKAKYTVSKDHGHIDHAYCITSHASQGKTVDEIFISQPSSTFGATNAKQFYVSVSRAKSGVSIYTDDKDLLLEYASELGDRQSALELIAIKTSHEKHMAMERHRQKSVSKTHSPKKEPLKEKPFTKQDYEPSL